MDIRRMSKEETETLDAEGMDKTLLERELEIELELADKLERARATGSEEEIVIDLDGPGGNAFYIVGIISRS
jgi:hypothetical protein